MAAAIVAANMYCGAVAYAFEEEEGAMSNDWTRIYLANWPSVSPDGSMIAFEWNSRIWRAPATGGEATPLTDPGVGDDKPRWSPDGTALYFNSLRDGWQRLYKMPLDAYGNPTGAPVPVTSHTEGAATRSFAPDGRVVAVALRDATPSSMDDAGENRRPYYLSDDGTEELIFDAPCNDIAISPDGKKALFTSNYEGTMRLYRTRKTGSYSSDNSDIWLYDMEKKTFEPLMERPFDELKPIWAPSGDGFYYLSGEGGVRNIWYMPLAFGKDGKAKPGKPEQKTFFKDTNVIRPSLSADGRTMAFLHGFDIHTIDPVQKKPAVKTVWLRPPVPVSPGKLQRAYPGLDNDYGYGNCTFTESGDVAFTAGGDVYVVSAKQQDPVLVEGSSIEHCRDCSFSRDGETLYWLADKGDGAAIRSAKRADSDLSWPENVKFEIKEIAPADKCRRSLSVSPDGKKLAWTDFHGKFHFATTDGEETHVAPVQPYAEQGYCWSPDGRYVAAALLDSHANTDIWIIPTSAKTKKGKHTAKPYNLSRSFERDSSPAWSPDGRIVAYSGTRASLGGTNHIFYAYIDPDDEKFELRSHKMRSKPPHMTLSGLSGRVRDTGVEGENPFFSHDGRTLSFNKGGKTYRIKLPESLKPEKTFDKEGETIAWFKGMAGGERVYRRMDNFPAYGDQQLKFIVFKTIDVADWQEVCFRTAWAEIRDGFCDPAWHGTDWEAMRGKYLPAARNAPDWNGFLRAILSMYGEIDASHLGFSANKLTAKKWSRSAFRGNWRPDTAHLGVRFDPEHKGKGWKVKERIPEAPADIDDLGLEPGDVIESIDGVEITPETKPVDVLNVKLPHSFRLKIRRGLGTRLLSLPGTQYEMIRRLLRKEALREMRAKCHREANAGYIALESFDDAADTAFADAVFAETEGRDALVFDLRTNKGGHLADKVIAMMCGILHDRLDFRNADNENAYIFNRHGKAAFPDLPVVVLIGPGTYSNAEEFAHAMKTLKRAKLVGVETPGMVIGVSRRPILDYGEANLPGIGFFLPDGTDMDTNGAKPDVEARLTPADIAAGRDPQLDAAIATAKEEAEKAKAKKAKLPPLRYAGSKK